MIRLLHYPLKGFYTMLTSHLRTRRFLAALCAVALLLVMTNLSHVHAQPTDLTGSYQVTCTNPTGTTYTGTLNITPSKATVSGATVYQLKWAFGDQQSVGLGVLYNDTLGAAFGTPDCVLSIYGLGNQSGGGDFTGVWSNITTQSFGTETVTFDKSLAKDHIAQQLKVSGTNPDNSTYSGQLTIEGYGLLYDLTWEIGSDTTKGVGLLLPKPTAVISASPAKTGEICSAVIYQVVDGDLYGTWASVGDKVTGTELALKN